MSKLFTAYLLYPVKLIVGTKLHVVFISNTFISNARLKLAKNQLNAKQHPETELLLFENLHIFHQRYHPKIIEHILKTKQKNKCVCMHEIIRFILMKKKMKIKKRSHRYNTYRPKPRCSKY